MRVRSTVTGSFNEPVVRSVKTRSSCSAGFSTQSTSTSYIGSVTTKTIEDVVTPGFTSLLKCGKFLPINPVDINTTIETRYAGDGSHYSSYIGGCYRTQNTGPSWGDGAGWLMEIPPYDSSLMNAASTSAIAEAKAGVFDALTWLAELKELRRLFRAQTQRLNGVALKQARKAWKQAGNSKKARKRLRSRAGVAGEIFAGLWLEARFAWRPLVFSVEDGLAAFYKEFDKSLYVVGSSQQVEELNLEDDLLEIRSCSLGDRYTTETIIGTRTYRSKAYAEVVNSTLARFQQDPLVTTWELIPYSFVSDYFFNIGDYLQAISPFSGAKLRGESTSIKTSVVHQRFYDTTWGCVNQNEGSHQGTSVKREIEHYYRFPGSGPAIEWNPKLTLPRVTDLVALVLGGRKQVRAALRGEL